MFKYKEITMETEKGMDRGTFFVKYLKTLMIVSAVVGAILAPTWRGNGFSIEIFGGDTDVVILGAVFWIPFLFHTYLLRKSAEMRCRDAGCDISLSKFSVISITGIPLFIYLFFKPTKPVVTDLQVVSSGRSFIGGIKDRIQTKNYVDSLETAARAKKAIETLTDTEKPSEVNVNLKGQAQTVSVADELMKLVKLRDDGVISEEEFLSLKANLMNQ